MRVRKHRGKIRVSLTKEARRNVQRGYHDLLVAAGLVTFRSERSPECRFGPSPFSGLQSAGMPGNEEMDPGAFADLRN